MKTDVLNLENTKVRTLELPEDLFNAPWRPELVRQVVVAIAANRRRPWAHVKDRSEVSGGGKKPWRQKGTGRARHGSTRSPLWRHGGKAHGPTKDRDYTQKINRKMKQAALASVLSRKLKDQELRVYEALALKEPKTKLASETFRKALEMAPRARRFDMLVVRESANKDLGRAVRNLPKSKVVSVNSISVEDLLNYKYVLFEEKAIEQLKSKD